VKELSRLVFAYCDLIVIFCIGIVRPGCDAGNDRSDGGVLIG